MIYAKDNEKSTDHFVPVNAKVKRKYRGISAFPPYATEEQKAQVLATGKPLQVKLKVSRSGDPAEIEADKIADKVMRMPDSSRQKQKINREMDSSVDEEMNEQPEYNGENNKEDPSNITFNAYKQEGVVDSSKNIHWHGRKQINEKIIPGAHSAHFFLKNYIQTSTYNSWKKIENCRFPVDAEPNYPQLGHSLRVCMQLRRGRSLELVRFFVVRTNNH